MTNIPINAQRLWSSLMEQATIGTIPGNGLCRLALSDDDAKIRHWFISQATSLGADISIDAVGNIYASLPGTNPALAPIAIGSHLDTQPTGGRFDGVLGVLAALEAARTLADLGLKLRHPLTLINWTNEEGARFAPAMIGSGVFAGVFTPAQAAACLDKNGISLGAELTRLGFAGTATPPKLAAYFELHIEQGPILEAQATQIGVVTGVQGIRWYQLTVTGSACHAGTTPMALRRDPVQATASILAAIENISRADPPRSVLTVGQLRAHPGSINTVPGHVTFSLDMRHPSESILERMEATLRETLPQLAALRGCSCTIAPIWAQPPTLFAPACIEAVRKAAQHLGYSHRDMVSGAGHDAAFVARVAPAGMIFVPCRNGISHNEAESITPAQAAEGANMLLQSIIRYDATVV